MIKKIFFTLVAISGLSIAFLPIQAEAVRLSVSPTMNVRQTFQNPEPCRRLVHRKYYPPVKRHSYRDHYYIEPLYVTPPECIEYYEEVYVPQHRVQTGMDFGLILRLW